MAHPEEFHWVLFLREVHSQLFKRQTLHVWVFLQVWSLMELSSHLGVFLHPLQQEALHSEVFLQLYSLQLVRQETCPQDRLSPRVFLPTGFNQETFLLDQLFPQDFLPTAFSLETFLPCRLSVSELPLLSVDTSPSPTVWLSLSLSRIRSQSTVTCLFQCIIQYRCPSAGPTLSQWPSPTP